MTDRSVIYRVSIAKSIAAVILKIKTVKPVHGFRHFLKSVKVEIVIGRPLILKIREPSCGECGSPAASDPKRK
jgi:hypothetical protein